MSTVITYGSRDGKTLRKKTQDKPDAHESAALTNDLVFDGLNTKLA